jgi:hypothetical protein
MSDERNATNSITSVAGRWQVLLLPATLLAGLSFGDEAGASVLTPDKCFCLERSRLVGGAPA